MHFCVIAILLGLASVCLLQILSGDRSILSDYYHLCATVVSLYHLCVLTLFSCCVHLNFDPAQCGTTCVFTQICYCSASLLQMWKCCWCQTGTGKSKWSGARLGLETRTWPATRAIHIIVYKKSPSFSISIMITLLSDTAGKISGSYTNKWDPI